MANTTEGLSLRERAAEARDRVKREQDARHDQEYIKQCDLLANLAAKKLGVEREDIQFERRNEAGAALGKIEGLSFAVYATEYDWTLQLVSPCEQCGQERTSLVYSIERLGELLESPKYFYHYCPAQRSESDTPEARLVMAIQAMIENTVAER